MVARARRVAGFGSGVKGWRVGVAVVRGPGAASAHEPIALLACFADVLKRVEISTVIHKCAQDSHRAWRSSGTLRRKCSVTDIS
jgi:hypothetical protein